MAFSSRGLQATLQVGLGIVIIVLVWLLIDSIVTPYREIEQRMEVTVATRARMDQVRQALILYERENGRYITSLDSLVMWLKSDSAMVASSDSIFGMGFVADSIVYSTRTGRKFELAVNDTSRTNTYLLSDPDSDDYIGTLEADITRLNAASWE